nr:hypothetical transcript [Hymenolepis microstoma]
MTQFYMGHRIGNSINKAVELSDIDGELQGEVKMANILGRMTTSGCSESLSYVFQILAHFNICQHFAKAGDYTWPNNDSYEVSKSASPNLQSTILKGKNITEPIKQIFSSISSTPT